MAKTLCSWTAIQRLRFWIFIDTWQALSTHADCGSLSITHKMEDTQNESTQF